ncbi:uncharacterized protein LOC144487465 [Mustelus asterias]
MGAEDEDLQGFKYRPGIHTTTQGVFIWSKPFLMDTDQGKMAIFLVDTEGCNSFEREKNVNIQLSALSMLLSSYLIFNIASKIAPTDLEFLEMFLDVAQKVGEVVNLDPIQHLDILVRDWDSGHTHGKEFGREYLDATRQRLASSRTRYQPFMKKELSKAQCYLLPHPGEAIACSSTGHSKEMTERFRNYLVEYFRCVLDSLPMSGRRDMSGSILTCSQLFNQIKLFAKSIEKYSLQIDTPLKMSNTLWNVKQREDKVQEFQNYLQEQTRATQDVLSRVKICPRSMEALLERKAMELRDDFQKKLRVSEEGPTAAIDELEKLLKNERECFSVNYPAMFMSAIEEMKNRTLQQFQGYCKEQTRATQDVLSRVKICPRSMEALLERKAMELRDDFQKKLRVSEEGPTAAIDELEKLLKNERECFSVNYPAMFMSAIEEMKNRTLQQFQGYCKEQERDTEGIFGYIKIHPGLMKRDVEKKTKELLADFGRRLDGDENEKVEQMLELERSIQSEVDSFCHAYGKRYRLEMVIFVLIRAFAGAGIGYMRTTAFGAAITALKSALTGAAGSALTGAAGSALTGAAGSALTGAAGSALTGAAGSALTGAAGSALTGAAGSALTGAAGSALTGAAGSALTGAAGSALTGAAGSALTGAAGSALTGAAGPTLIGAAGSALTGAAGSALIEAAVPTLTGACQGAITDFGLLSLMQYIERGDDAEEENGLQKLIVWLQKKFCRHWKASKNP